MNRLYDNSIQDAHAIMDDLVEALQEARAYIICVNNNGFPPPACVAGIDAAIAKATGGAQ